MVGCLSRSRMHCEDDEYHVSFDQSLKGEKLKGD